MRHRSRPRWSIQGKRDEDLEAPEVSAAWQSDHAHVLLLVSHPRAQLFGWGDAVLISVLRRSLGLLIAVAAAARHFAIPPWSLSPNQPKLFDYRRVCRWSCGNKKKGRTYSRPISAKGIAGKVSLLPALLFLLSTRNSLCSRRGFFPCSIHREVCDGGLRASDCCIRCWSRVLVVVVALPFLSDSCWVLSNFRRIVADCTVSFFPSFFSCNYFII